ncbi:MAG: sugar kinase [Serratia liquefaciens]|nr:sugar kinase [Serratia liquefaciens]
MIKRTILVAISALTFSCHVFAQGNAIPGEENQFIHVVSSAATEAKKTHNNEQRVNIKLERDNSLCQTLSTRPVNQWAGEVVSSQWGGNEDDFVRIKLADNITVQSAKIPTSSGKLENTLPKNIAAQKLKIGDKVTFSGKFAPGTNACIWETSITLDGGLFNPNFAFNFDNISAVQ